jgi:hypothetical protein
MREPARTNRLDELVPWIAVRVDRIVARLRMRGFDPRIYETRRTVQRQRWLFGQGRSKWECVKERISPAYANPTKPRVTKTLDSRHIVGKAVDIISAKHGWSNSKFFDALAEEAAKEGMHSFLWDRAHIEW